MPGTVRPDPTVPPRGACRKGRPGALTPARRRRYVPGAPAPPRGAAPHPSAGRSRLGKLIVLMVTAFVDMVGLLMVIPLIPFYAMKLGAGGIVVGILVSAFSLAQLLSAPLWGRVSDRYGRRPALLVGLGASALAYVTFAFAQSIWLLLLSRLIQGAGGGTTGVVQAYVADATEPKDRAKSLGWLSAATNLGVTIGPLLGSASLALSVHAPGLLAAGLCVANMGFAWVYLRETRVMAAPGAASARVKPRTVVARVITHPGEPAPRMIWIYAIGMGAFSGFTALLALFLNKRFGITAQTIGWAYAWNGGISVLVRAFVLGKAVDRFGEARLSRLGQILLTAGLALMPMTWRFGGSFALPFQVHVKALAVANGWSFLLPSFGAGSTTIPLKFVALAVVMALIPLGTAFTFPCVTATLSRIIKPTERGLYMGVQQSFGGAARVIGPIWAGWAFDALGTPYPFWTSAGLVFGTIFLGLGMERFTRDAPETPGAESIPAKAGDPVPAAD
ncbi:MAG: multidrug resistance protein [Gemmatimonadetes bacterium]|nr:multidrug resistance protein [Gemmatimonadota bacterium]